MADSKQLDLFSAKQPIRDIAGVQWVEYRPVAPVQDGCCIEFQIPPTSQQYLDLDHSLLKLKVALTKADGSEVSNDDHVGLTNAVLHSIFSQVDVLLNDLNISPNVGANHPYRAFLELLLDEPSGRCSRERLKLEGYENVFLWSEGDYDNANTLLGSEVAAGKVMDMIGKIRTDACSLNKYIPNGVEVKIKLYQSSNAFRVTAKQDGDYKLIIKDAVLKVCQVKVSPAELIHHDEEFSKAPAKYDYVRTDVKSFQIPAGAYNANYENLYGGKAPLEIVVGLVSASAYSGKTDKNPFKFANFKLNHVEITVDGVSAPGPPLKPDFLKDHFAESLLTLFKEGDYGNVTNLTYKTNSCLYRFDLEPYVDEDSVPQLKSGNVRVNVGFAQALPEGVTLILRAKFADRFLIDRERNVYQDEAAAAYLRTGY